MMARACRPGRKRWFAVMERNASHVTDYYNLPGDQVVAIGCQIAI
jgi:KUP system potassium uptake protein